MTPQRRISAALLFIAIAGVNAGNYLLNLGLGRFLGPEQFAEAGILATLVLVLSFIAVGLQLTAAKIIAGILEENGAEAAKAAMSWGIQRAFTAGVVLAVCIALFANQLQAFLQFERSMPFYILALGIPVYFVLSIQRGFLQGIQRFGMFARSYAIEMVGRVVGTVVFIYIFMQTGTGHMTEAIALGFLVSFAAGAGLAGTFPSRSLSAGIGPAYRSAAIRLFGMMMFYEFTQIIISYSDSILVKHYHDDHTAGLYTALSLIGRMVYFATWSVVMMLIPKVVERAAKGQPHAGLFRNYFILVCLCGLFITAICAIAPGTVVGLLFGQAYLDIQSVLWKYALATTLFAAANVFAYYHMAMDRYVPVFLAAAAGLVQVAGIVLVHGSIEFIINLQVAIMSLLLTAMYLFHNTKTSSYEKTETSYRYALSAK